MTHLQIGARVKVLMFGDTPEPGLIVAGPIVRRGLAVFKVRLAEFDNWYPADQLRPVVEAV